MGRGRARFQSSRLRDTKTEAPLAPSKTIFLHIPKTGGTTLGAVLRAAYADGEVVALYSNDPEHRAIMRSQIEAARVIHGHLSFGVHEDLGLAEARYVTVVRDPIKRVASLYRHQARDPSSELFGAISDGMSLRDVLISGRYPQFNNHMVRVIARVEDSDPATDARLLDQACSNLDRWFDFVGVTEHLDDSVELLSKFYSWRGTPGVPRLNVDAHPDLVIDEATEATIRQHNELDITLYDHIIKEKSLTDRRSAAHVT